MAKPRAVRYECVTEPEPADVLARARQWHVDLEGARIVLVWEFHVAADRDGYVRWGECRLVSDLEKELCAEPWDFVIVLNREAWDRFDDRRRLALVDHELCHAAPLINKAAATQAVDERGRYLWRIRRHDIEEFGAIVERHGLWKEDLAEFAEALKLEI